MTWANALEENLPEDHLRIPMLTLVRNPLWRDVAMTSHPSLQNSSADQARWPLLERLTSGGLGDDEFALLPLSRCARIVWLVRLARKNEAAARSLLGFLGPELVSMRRRLVRLGTEADDAEAIVLLVAWEVVRGRRARRCPRSERSLTEAIWRAARHDSGVRRRRVETVPLGICSVDKADELTPLDGGRALLAAAAAADVLSPRQVAIIRQSRIDGCPLSEVARRLGRPYDAVRMERQRGEQALRDFALSYDWPTS
jgi:DNA-directed RNA polymerase specialized sigma24 family protein